MQEEEPQLLQRHGFNVECRGARMGTAFHEAGHYVSAFALGGDIKVVVIDVRYLRGECGDVFATFGGYCGTWCEGGFDFENMARPEIADRAPAPGGFLFPAGMMLPRAIVSCAGPAAEAKYRFLRGLPQTTKHTARSDRRDLADFAQIERNACGADPAAFLERAWRGAQQLLDQPAGWRGVDALANALVTGICAAAPENPHPGDRAEFVLSRLEAETILTRAGLAPGMFLEKNTSPIAGAAKVGSAPASAAAFGMAAAHQSS
jgi:hypothetical protein